jgi:hypothetical protein
MTKLHIIAGLTSFALALGSTLALAQMGQGGGGPPEGTPFESIDADGNGLISLTEATEWMGGVFGAMDADSNNSLTMEEYMALRMGPGAGGEGMNPTRQAAMQEAKADRFKAMDKNGDGAVSHEEFMNHEAARFNAAGSAGITRQQWTEGH